MGRQLIDWEASVGPCIQQTGPTTSGQKPLGKGCLVGAHSSHVWLGTHSMGLTKTQPGSPACAVGDEHSGQGCVDEVAPTARCPMRRGMEKCPRSAAAPWAPGHRCQGAAFWNPRPHPPHLLQVAQDVGPAVKHALALGGVEVVQELCGVVLMALLVPGRGRWDLSLRDAEPTPVGWPTGSKESSTPPPLPKPPSSLCPAAPQQP